MFLAVVDTKVESDLYQKPTISYQYQEFVPKDIVRTSAKLKEIVNVKKKVMKPQDGFTIDIT